LLLHAWYFDDGTVIGDLEEVAMVLDIIKGLFPVDILAFLSSGVRLLGGAVSTNAYFISGLVIRRAANAVDLMSLLPQLHDPQRTTILLDSPESRQDIVREVLFEKWRRARISAKKEAPVNFLTDPSDERSTFRPTDILVFGWFRGKHVCVDLTGVSSLVGLISQGFTAGQAALKAASCKVKKHKKASIKNQHVLIPFAFDTFGFLAREAVELSSRAQRVMNNNVMTHRSTNVVFKRIGFAPKRASGAACCPFSLHHYIEPDPDEHLHLLQNQK
ncbi:hypothetical protein Tco_0908022, partial [Tanacetum coccineum]